MCSRAPSGVVFLNFLIRNTSHSHQRVFRGVFLRGDFRTPLAHSSRRSTCWGLRIGRTYSRTLSTHFFLNHKINKVLHHYFYTSQHHSCSAKRLILFREVNMHPCRRREITGYCVCFCRKIKHQQTNTHAKMHVGFVTSLSSPLKNAGT